ncbi:hypothetical protein PoB_002915800 [Plakobranchus ocellatus]|uniref:Uncharacterized protein n=1 Tax=Plakobranchus ocellatus TaxID=259542 RepID=A0AAV4A7P5_9GAST|nr:hypothetical protein PoB_002915800 [Plakobranchus ocellatus]
MIHQPPAPAQDPAAVWLRPKRNGYGVLDIQGMKVIPRIAERKVSGADLEGRSSGGTEDNESDLRSAETILLWVQARHRCSGMTEGLKAWMENGREGGRGLRGTSFYLG